MAATQKEIAEQLGISITTVSRALCSFDNVAEETRQQVIVMVLLFDRAFWVKGSFFTIHGRFLYYVIVLQMALTSATTPTICFNPSKSVLQKSQSQLVWFKSLQNQLGGIMLS